MHYDDWDQLLMKRFPPRTPDAEKQDWETVRENFSVGQTVSGVVVAKAAFGAWLDIGAGFPALLLIPDVAGLTPERYRADDWCPVGGIQETQIVLFNDPEHRVRVAQGIPHEDRDSTVRREVREA